MVLPEQLQTMDAYLTEVGRISPYEALQFRKILSAYERDARRRGDVVMLEEIQRLRVRMESAASPPPLRVMEPERMRSRPDLEREAAAVWRQISLDEQLALMPQYVDEELPVEQLTGRELVMIADYPRSEQRRQYLRAHRGGLRRVSGYRRRWY